MKTQSFKHFWVRRRGVEVPVLATFFFHDKTFSEGGVSVDVEEIIEPVEPCSVAIVTA